LNIEWRKFGQIHINYDDEFEVKIQKPNKHFRGWLWSCKRLGIDKQFIDIENDDAAMRKALELTLEEVDKFSAELVSVRAKLEGLLSEE